MEDKSDRFTTNEQAQASVRKIAIVFLAIGFALAYWIWPSGITDLTFASVTFGGLLRAIGSGVVVVVSCGLAAMLWN